MQPAQLEATVIRLIEDLLAGHPVEDTLFECKSDWGAPERQARQLAAHANGARGAEITWVIGVDQSNKTVLGADAVELANWYPQIESRFDGNFAPRLIRDLRVPFDSQTVVALHFETDRAPYVVRGDGKCQHNFEVPVRVGTHTRSANRMDLLRMLAPTIAIPDVELVEAKAEFSDNRDERTRKWTFEVKLYLIPKTRDRITIPFHKVHATVSGPHEFDRFNCSLKPLPVPIPSLPGAVVEQQEQLSICGPGVLVFRGESRSAWSSTLPCNFRLMIRLPIAEAGGAAVTTTVRFGEWTQPNHPGHWVLQWEADSDGVEAGEG
jgi:hypothetical protein